MIIKIQYFPEANDRMDADATDPHYFTYAPSFVAADEFLGKIERVTGAEGDKKVLDQEVSESIPF